MFPPSVDVSNDTLVISVRLSASNIAQTSGTTYMILGVTDPL
jgi:hypothetical protein